MKKIAVINQKGGVGKTVVSCITAVWLARQGYKSAYAVPLIAKDQVKAQVDAAMNRW